KNKKFIFPDSENQTVSLNKIINHSPAFHSSPVRQTNESQAKDEWDTVGRRITFTTKRASCCDAGK
ncbi:hypothetical protein, partial [Bacteroides pyogenes]|uniref:hypothetical protein n=1 Tax=Bacteroides pyogenes TaxID=310300 RepID=UPI001BA663E5